jgi:hypothetical protein
MAIRKFRCEECGCEIRVELCRCEGVKIICPDGDKMVEIKKQNKIKC